MAGQEIGIALLGGILPALVWLGFWLREDRCEPEPKRYIVFTFVLGMLAVLLVLPVEKFFVPMLGGGALLLVWAAAEELFKFGAAYFGALRWSAFDEPLDAVVYMVTAALGFSALENALFLLTPLGQGEPLRALIVGDLRFLGATLLHTLASASVGLALALAYYKRASIRRMAALGGVILAIFLHTLFNFFILSSGGGKTFWLFLCIWVGIVAVLFMTERVKTPAKDYC